MVQAMNASWNGTLFHLWQFVNSHEGGKLFLSVVFLAPLVYVAARLLALPSAVTQSQGTRHTTSIEAKKQRRRLHTWGGVLMVVNLITLALYVRVWILVPDNAKEFPSENHVAATWGGCVAAAVVTVILLSVFEAKYKGVNPKT
jgi:SNF family Na+-dependent transporter